jgi:hypothetical protein
MLTSKWGRKAYATYMARKERAAAKEAKKQAKALGMAKSASTGPDEEDDKPPTARPAWGDDNADEESGSRSGSGSAQSESRSVESSSSSSGSGSGSGSSSAEEDVEDATPRRARKPSTQLGTGSGRRMQLPPIAR